MTSETVFLVDALFAALICLGIVAYLKKHLRLLLIELCGTAERGGFWLALCNVTLVLVPLIFVLGYAPALEPNKNVVFEIAGQIKAALFGIVITLGGLALVLLKFIPHDSSRPAAGSVR
jgi:hypothetical protein